MVIFLHGRNRIERYILVHQFFQIISRQSSSIYRSTIPSACKWFNRHTHPGHPVTDNSQIQTRVASGIACIVIIHVRHMRRIVPVERCAILHLKIIYQVLCRSCSSFSPLKSYRHIVRLERVVLIVFRPENQLRTVQYNVSSFCIVKRVGSNGRQGIFAQPNDIVRSLGRRLPFCGSVARSGKERTCRIQQCASTDS